MKRLVKMLMSVMILAVIVFSPISTPNKAYANEENGFSLVYLNVSSTDESQSIKVYENYDDCKYSKEGSFNYTVRALYDKPYFVYTRFDGQVALKVYTIDNSGKFSIIDICVSNKDNKPYKYWKSEQHGNVYLGNGEKLNDPQHRGIEKFQAVFGD